VATDLRQIIVNETDDEDLPASTPPPVPTSTPASTNPPSPPPTSSTTTRTVEQPPANSPPPQAPPSPPPPANPSSSENEGEGGRPSPTTGRPPSGPVTPRPVALPVNTGDEGHDSGHESDDDSDDDSEDDETASGVSTPPSSLPANTPPAGSIDTGAGGIAPSASSPTSDSGPIPNIEGKPATAKSNGPSTAVVATLATLGALIGLIGLFCLVRYCFIRRRRARRDAWAARPLTWIADRKVDYASTATNNEKTFSDMPRVERSYESHSDTTVPPKPLAGQTLPANWVDIERGAPVLIGSALVLNARESIHSVESYNNLTREPLICHRPSMADQASVSSGRPSVTTPPPAVLASRWSPGSSPRDSGHSDSSDGSAHEDSPLVRVVRLSLADMYQSTAEPPLQPTPPAVPTAPPPTKPRSAKSALMSALFSPVPLPVPTVPSPELVKAPSTPPRIRRKSVPSLEIHPATGPLPAAATRDSTTSTIIVARAHEMPTIVVTPPPKSPAKAGRSASELFADEDPFASPLDRD